MNNSIQNFIEHNFNTKEKLPLETNITTFCKKHVLISPGQLEENLYFIRSGIIQVSVLDENENEKILSFSFQNQFCCALSSLITQSPSKYTLTCISECTLEIIPRDKLYAALDNSFLVNKLFRYFVESAYLYRLKKQTDLLTLDAKTRYEELLKLEPEIAKLLSVSKIAQYLGIHTRSLSRIRAL